MRYDKATQMAQAKATSTTGKRLYRVTDPVAVGGSKMPQTRVQELTEKVATNLRKHGSTVEEIIAAAPADSTVVPAVQQYRDAVAAFRAADARCLATLHAGETDAYTIASRERKAARELRTRLESTLPQDCRDEEIAAADYMQKLRASEDNNLTNTGDKATMKTANTTTTTKSNKTAAKKAAEPNAAVVNELRVELDEPSTPKAAASKKTQAAAPKVTEAKATTKEAAAPKSAEPAKAAAKGASKTTAKTEAVKTESTAKAEAGGDRAAKLRETVAAVFNRINDATIEQPLQRSELSSIERRIARGLAQIGAATRLEENGRNIRYHRAGDAKEMPKLEAAINKQLTDDPKVFV